MSLLDTFIDTHQLDKQLVDRKVRTARMGKWEMPEEYVLLVEMVMLYGDMGLDDAIYVAGQLIEKGHATCGIIRRGIDHLNVHALNMGLLRRIRDTKSASLKPHRGA